MQVRHGSYIARWHETQVTGRETNRMSRTPRRIVSWLCWWSTGWPQALISYEPTTPKPTLGCCIIGRGNPVIFRNRRYEGHEMQSPFATSAGASPAALASAFWGRVTTVEFIFWRTWTSLAGLDDSDPEGSKTDTSTLSTTSQSALDVRSAAL